VKRFFCCLALFPFFLLFPEMAAAVDFTGIWTFSNEDGTEYSFDLVQRGAALEGTFSTYEPKLDKYGEAHIEGSVEERRASFSAGAEKGVLAMEEGDVSARWTPQRAGSEGLLPPSGSVLRKDFGAMGFRLLSGEKHFVLDDAETEKDVLKLLGKPEKKSKAEFWGADGLIHQRWFYKKLGIAVDFVKEDKSGVGEAFSVTISAPSERKTSRGIGIGSTRREVLKAYAAEINREESRLPETIVAGSVYGGVVFTMKNNSVVSIFIGAAAE
jgi:hypothetical protein